MNSFVRAYLPFVLGAFALAVAPISAQRTELQGPPIPYEDVGACPFEGCVYREWVANAPVAVRASRRADARIAFRVRTGEHVQAVTGVVITEKPGRAQFRTPVDLDAYNKKDFSRPAHESIHVEPGETLYLLTYRGEGATAAWFKGRLYDQLDGASLFNYGCTITPTPSACNGRIVEPVKSTWWIQLKSKTGAIGWTNEPGKFDNKDAFG